MALLHGTLTGRVTGDALFLTARRYYDGADTYLTVASNIYTTPPTRAACTQQAGLVADTGSTTALNAGTTYGAIPKDTACLTWSERVPRTVPPVLTYMSSVLSDTTYGIVTPNSNIAPPSYTSQNLIWDNSQLAFKNAITSSGVIMISTSGAAPGDNTVLKLVVAYVSSSLATSPPMLSYGSTDDNCSDVVLYDGSGPFGGTFVSSYTIANAALVPNQSPNAYYIQRDGTVTILFDKPPADALADLYTGRYVAPAQTSATTATAWSPATPSAGFLVVPSTTGTDYAPDLVMLCNNGASVVRVVYQTSSIKLRGIDPAYSSTAVFTVGGTADGVITKADYEMGIMFAFGDAKMVWFDTTPLAFYRVIDMTNPAAPTCSAAVATTMDTTGVVDIKYMGMSATGLMYVAVVYATVVKVYTCDYDLPTAGWTLVSSPAVFDGNTTPIVSVSVDTIVGAGSSLLVAFTTDTDVTLYQEVALA